MTRDDPTTDTTSSASGGTGSLVIPILLLAVIALLFLNGLRANATGEASWSWAWLGEWSWERFWTWDQVDQTLRQIPIFLQAQRNTAWNLLLWSLLPGFAGLLYRRSFGRWFWLAFLVLTAINAVVPALVPGFGSVSAKLEADLDGRYSFYVAIEALLILLLLSFRLYWRRHRLVDLPLFVLKRAAWLVKFLVQMAVALVRLLFGFVIDRKKSLLWGLLLLPVKLVGLALGLVALVVVLVLGVLVLAYTSVRALLRLAKKSEGAQLVLPPELRKALKESQLEAAWNGLSYERRRELATALEAQPGMIDEVLASLRPKNIVVCLDGTWNEPGQLDFGKTAQTNVLKLFKLMKREGLESKSQYNASGHRTYSWGLESDPLEATWAAMRTVWRGEGARLKEIGAAWRAIKAAWVVPQRQLALYYRGVGNRAENNPLAQKLGGAFGLGAAGIVERAYLDVARVYKPGDRLFIFGFSRGAAIARLLAGAIGRRGVPKSIWTLFLFGRHFTVWKSSKKRVQPKDIKVDVLGCWDTVGAFGISKNILGIPFQKIDLLKDLTVSQCVQRAYHMVALDETRDAFVPTLMDPDPTEPERIVEVWFAGNHANVGGGYATDKLSNVTLAFLLEKVSSGYAHKGDRQGAWPPGAETWGLYLKAVDTEAKIKAEAVAKVRALANALAAAEAEAKDEEQDPEEVKKLRARLRDKLGDEVGQAMRAAKKEAQTAADELDEALRRAKKDLRNKEKLLSRGTTDASKLPALAAAGAKAKAKVEELESALPGAKKEVQANVNALAHALAGAKAAPEATAMSLEEALAAGAAEAKAIGEVWIDANPLGQIRYSTGPIYKHEPRRLPLRAIIHESVLTRMRELEYSPKSLFNLNQKILEVRYEIVTALKQLREEATEAKAEAVKKVWEAALEEARERVAKFEELTDKAKADLETRKGGEDEAGLETAKKDAEKFKRSQDLAQQKFERLEQAWQEAEDRQALGGGVVGDRVVEDRFLTVGREALERWLASHGTGTLTWDQAESALEWANGLTIKRWPPTDELGVEPRVALANPPAPGSTPPAHS